MILTLVSITLLGATPAAPAATDELAALMKAPSFDHALAVVRGEDAALIRRGLSEPRTRQLVAWALSRHAVPAVREALEPLVASSDQVLAYYAALAIGAIGDARSVPVLADQLPEKAGDYWELVQRTKRGRRPVFDRIRQGRTETIFAKPHQHNLRVTCAAMEALGRIGGADAEKTLTRALGSEQHLVRYGAVRGLAALGKPARARLEHIAHSDPVLVVRAAAQRGLARLDGSDEVAEPPLGRLAHVPAIAFIKTKHRSDATFGFRDSYFFPKTPWFAAGENVFSLTPPRPDGVLRNLTNLENGAVQGLEVSADGKRLLLAMRPNVEQDSFHVYEMDIDGTGVRQITFGSANDVDPAYLPDGRIAFSSDRDGTHEYYHQERVRTLCIVNADGTDLRQFTFNPNQDYEPYALADGQILFSSYRFYGQDGSGGVFAGNGGGIARIETHLRTIRPDGTNDRHLYGSQRGSFFVPVRAMPDGDGFQAPQLRRSRDHLGVSVSGCRQLPDGRLVCTTPAGLTLVDLTLDPLDRDLPLFPEVVNVAGGEEVYIHSHDDLNPVGRYTTPCPVDNDTILVSHAPFHDRAPSAYALYLFDLRSRRQTLVYDDPARAEVDVVTLVARPAAPAIRGSGTAANSIRVSNSPLTIHHTSSVPPVTARAAATPETGELFIQSVFHSDLSFDRSAVRYVRVATAEQLGITMNANGAFRSRIIGTVPIESDGSVRIRVPANTPVHLALLDAEENILVHETAFNSVAPGEVLSCIGCHESKKHAPPASPRMPEAMKHPPHHAQRGRGDLIFMGRPQHSYSVFYRP